MKKDNKAFGVFTKLPECKHNKEIKMEEEPGCCQLMKRERNHDKLVIKNIKKIR